MEIAIDPYSEKNKGDFERLWVSWLTNSMGLVPQQEDLDEVRNPLRSRKILSCGIPGLYFLIWCIESHQF